MRHAFVYSRRVQPTLISVPTDDLLPTGPLTVLVTGSRIYQAVRTVYSTLDTFRVGLLIEGGAAGADRLGRAWAIQHGVSYKEYPADWKEHGKAAGPRRNRFMYTDSKPDLVVAFKDHFGQMSGGTEDMVAVARTGGTPVWLVDRGFGRWFV